MTFGQIWPLWKESLVLFKWNNLKLFFLAVLNNYQRSVKIVVKNFWWLLLGAIIAQNFVFGLAGGLHLFLSFLFALIARPSIERKDTAYFMTYLKKFPGYMLISFFFVLILYLVFVLQLPGISVLSFILPVLFCMSLFFFFDVKNSFKNTYKALLQSIKINVYFFPAMLILMAFWYMIASIPAISLGWAAHNNWSVFPTFFVQASVLFVTYLISILPFSVLAMYYTKIKHSHHRLFFE